MPDMQSRHCCLCVTGVLATFVGLMLATAGISFVLNYRISDLALPPQWQTVSAKKNIGIAMIVFGLLFMATGVLVSLCFFLPMKLIFIRRKAALTSISSGDDKSSMTSSKDKPDTPTDRFPRTNKPSPRIHNKPLVSIVTPPSPDNHSFPLPIQSTTLPTLPIVKASHYDFTHKNKHRSRKSTHNRKRPRRRLTTHEEEVELGETELRDKRNNLCIKTLNRQACMWQQTNDSVTTSTKHKSFSGPQHPVSFPTQSSHPLQTDRQLSMEGDCGCNNLIGETLDSAEDERPSTVILVSEVEETTQVGCNTRPQNVDLSKLEPVVSDMSYTNLSFS